MIKPLDVKTLSNITGGHYGNFVVSAIRAVAVSGWHHRRDIRNGYYTSPFHD